MADTPAKPLKASSQYRGVSFNNQIKKWKAVITVGRSQHFLGYYVEEEEAARAYDEASRRLRGPSAPVNFPTDGTRNDNDMDVCLADVFQGSANTMGSLTKLSNAMDTVESVESVRDPQIEIEAVKATLAKQRQLTNPDFMSL